MDIKFNTTPCGFCNGTGIEPGKAGCVWCASTGVDLAVARDIPVVSAPIQNQLRAALEHIQKTAGQSRTQSRRLRWIAKRAELALAGRPYVASEHELPKDGDSEHYKLLRQKTALKERVDLLEADIREKECLLLKCMEAFNNCVGMASQNARMKWYEAYLKPVSGSVLVHFSKGIQRALDEPAECDDTTIEEEREDAKKVFIRTNTKQGQNVSLADMLSRYETKP